MEEKILVENLTQEELDCIIEEKDRSVKLYENFRKRISALHTYASNIGAGGGSICGQGRIDRNDVARTLKKIAFGQYVPKTYTEFLDGIFEKNGFRSSANNK